MSYDATVTSHGLKTVSAEHRGVIVLMFLDLFISMSTQDSTTLIVFAAVAVTVLLAVSTGAVVIDQPTDLINNKVALQPGDNPYAYLDEGGELAIDIIRRGATATPGDGSGGSRLRDTGRTLPFATGG